MSELIFESGIVIKKEMETLEVSISEKAGCEECSAKIYCKPEGNNTKTVLVKDTLNSMIGDKVEFAINGSGLLKASFSLYGFPIILVISVILICNYLLPFSKNKELYSIILSLASLLLYYFIVFIFSKKNQHSQNMPYTVKKL